LLSIFDASYDRFHLYGVDLSGTNLRDDELAQIAQIQHIKQLNLGGTQISDASCRVIATLPFLQSLDLNGTAVTDAGISRLSKRQNLASLRVAGTQWSKRQSLASLRVVGTQVSYQALEQLDAALPFAHFAEERAIEELQARGIQVVDFRRHIEVADNPSLIAAGPEAIDVIVGMNRRISLTAHDVERLGHLQSLRKMTFHTVTVAPAGLDGLKPLARLRDLSFWLVDLTDDDLRVLGNQRQLESLTIYGCTQVTGAGLAHLNSLTNLKALSIKACPGVTKQSMASLARKLPNCQCEFAEY
jgi:hypothetical protein